MLHGRLEYVDTYSQPHRWRPGFGDVRLVVQPVVNRVGLHSQAPFDVTNQHWRKSRIKSGVGHMTREPRPGGLLQVVDEGGTVLPQLLPEKRNALGVPAHRGIRAAHCLHALIGKLPNRPHPKEFIYDRRGPPL